MRIKHGDHSGEAGRNGFSGAKVGERRLQIEWKHRAGREVMKGKYFGQRRMVKIEGKLAKSTVFSLIYNSI